MPFDLTELEQTALMNAVAQVINPWMYRKPTTQELNGKEILIYLPTIRPDAPSAIKALEDVYGGIIDKGAIAGGPF